MPLDYSKEIEITVNTLLQVGELVMEISREHCLTGVWHRRNSRLGVSMDGAIGKNILEIRNDNIVTKAALVIESCFLTGEGGYMEYATMVNDAPVTFGIRIISCHPAEGFVFVVVETLQPAQKVDVVEDKWKLALDASGDGVWDINLETKSIFFSDKWHEMFGYAANEITTVEQWSAKVHPDDHSKSEKNIREYLSGNLPSYTNEIRYLCKDGSWKWILSKGAFISRAQDGMPLRFIGTHTDIHERKIAEDKYAATAQLLAKLINNLQESIMVVDENWQVIYVNEMFKDLYALEGSDNELIGMDMKKNLEHRKRAYSDPEKFVRRTIDIFNRKEVVLNEEWELADGTVLVRDYIPLSMGDNSKGGIWKFRNITEQRSIEKRFDEQRLFYENILHNIPADIAVFDAEHRYLFVNKNGFKNDDLRKYMIGRTDEDYARYSNRPYSFVETRFALYDNAVKGREQVEYIEKLISKEGKVGHHLRLIKPVFFEDGSLEFLMAYGVQITELIVAQEELKTSIDTFSSAFDYSGIGMALIGINAMWLDANKVLCDITGYSKAQLLGMSYYDITYPPDKEIDRPQINQLLNKEIQNYTVEKRYVSKDNKIILVSLTVSLVWKDDAPDFFIAQVVDITEKKALENDIRRKNMVLEATRISLVNKIAQLEELSHIIAHNLRGPAGNVKMFSEILLAKHSGKELTSDYQVGDAFTNEEVVQFIYESSTALMTSLSTLMEITQIKLNKEIPYNDCDVAAMINGIVSQLQSTIYEKKAVIKYELDVNVISYPKAYLENILYNLVSNSLKYSSTQRLPEIIIATSMQSGNKVQVRVKDNGLGINLDRYGDKVFKLNQVFHKGYDSKGVGLYITKTQVESLGGKIEVKSKPNEGCEFIVTL